MESRYEKWLYVLENLHELECLPEKLQEKIFQKVFTVAKIAKFTHEEYMSYEEDLKVYRDLKNVFDTAIEEARKKSKWLFKVLVCCSPCFSAAPFFARTTKHIRKLRYFNVT